MCDAGKTCTSTTAAPTTCPANTFSALGSTKCSTCPTGSECTDSTQNSAKPCLFGQYLNTATGRCTTCPSGQVCTETATMTQAAAEVIGLGCPKGYYPKGKSCAFIGTRSSWTEGASAPTQCTSSQYVPSPGSACTTCPAGSACQQVPCPTSNVNTETCTPCPAGLSVCSQATIEVYPRKCPIGYYAVNQACTICPEGQYCADQITAVACPAKQYSGKGFTACVVCPAGYDCTSKKLSTLTKCSAGKYSLLGDGVCTACAVGESCPAQDVAKTQCIPGTKMSTANSDKSCSICPSGSSCATAGVSNPTTCPAKQYSFPGSTACTACPNNGVSPCQIDKIGAAENCPLGTLYDSASKSCKACASGYECNNDAKVVCPYGTIYDANYARCVECTETHICVYTSSGPIDRWCYGKDPTVGLTIIDLFINANRLPFYHYQFCIDCNHPDMINKLCTFSTNYFTNQTGANLTCPASRTYKQEVTIAGEKYIDQRSWDRVNSNFPFCVADIDLYYPQFTHFKYTTAPQCNPTVEYLDETYVRVCKQTYPGFASVAIDPTTHPTQTPTDSPLETQFSIIEQSSMGTKTVLKKCQEGQELVTKGSGSQEQACQIKKAGDCKDPNSAFCRDGVDFKCPNGFKLVTTTYDGITPGDKKSRVECRDICPAGSVCSNQVVTPCSTASNNFCLDGTEDAGQYSARPGRQMTTSSVYPSVGETSCVNKNCFGPTPASTCPAGYHPDVTNNGHSNMNCHPNAQKTVTTYTYGDGTATASVSNCADGFYCPEGVPSTDKQLRCEPGTFHNSATDGPLKSKTQCVACAEGKYCSAGTTTSTVGNCQGGAYCKNRTHHPMEYPCPPGQYCPDTNNFASDTDPTQCTAGTYCKEGTTTPVTCPTNAYCPQKSTLFTDCPVNKYNPNTGSTQSSACQSCTANNICPGGTDPIQCPAGFTQETTNTDPKAMKCKPTTVGKFTATPAQSESVCPNGQYSWSYATQCFTCREGFSCSSGNIIPCPLGSYCPPGSSSQGTCTAGEYCITEKQSRHKNCPAGQYCPTGSSDSAPRNTPLNYFNVQGETTGTLHQCGNGYLCKGNSTGPYDYPCPANTQAALGETTCKACSLGKYCPTGSGSELDCPIGFYCNGLDPYPTKCPKGSYGASTNLKSAAECTTCPAGKTCSQNGLIDPDGDCDAGYFCTSGAWTPRPDGSDHAQKLTGDLCPQGAFCPKGSTSPQACPDGTYNSFPGMRSPTDCIDCTPGYYCSGSKNSQPTGVCQAGYYCISGSSTPQQYTSQPGYYSLAGSSMQIKCESGSYSASTAASACTPCDAGKYCPSIGLTEGTPCPAGNYCPQGAINPSPCPMGTYNPSSGTSGSGACKPCDGGSYCGSTELENVTGLCAAGYYCYSGSPSQFPVVYLSTLPLAKQVISVTTSGLCPKGYYCPEGTTTPQACGIGYYLNAEGSKASTDCIKCKPGWYCNTTGLANPVAKCNAGYFCPEGSTSPTQSPCTPGHYCVTGSPNEVVCAGGYYQSGTSQSTCLACGAGYYCEEGSAAQTDCPAGYYCAALSIIPTPCPKGTLNLLTKQTSIAACLTCPTNMFCKVSGSNNLDQIGYGNILDGYQNAEGSSTSAIPKPPTGKVYSYCERGSTCTAGTMIPCPAGKYCESYGLTYPTGNCSEGFYCLAGSKTKAPMTLAADLGAPCPISQYCLAGSSSGTKCPVGTFSSGTGLFSLSDCNPCPPGFVCSQLGTTGSTMSGCPEGSYCNYGTQSTANAVQCPAGFYCPFGSAVPVPCAPGYYSQTFNYVQCGNCPIGSYCPYNSNSGTIPGDGYIVSSEKMASPSPCPPGQFKTPGNHQSCTDCPAGFYCDEWGIQGPLATARQCPPGFYCPAKTSDYMKYMCEPGFYCPAGSSAAQPCTPGSYCSDYMLSAPTGLCEGGYICISKATKPNPEDLITGSQCPKGQYCPSGSSTGTKCSSGTYNDKEGASDSSFCLTCPPNKLCVGLGVSQPVSVCDKGYYCDTDSNGVRTKTLCEPGFMCPENSVTKFKCQPGTYQDLSGQDSCKPCVKGYYCYNDNGSPISAMKDCPAGFYCEDKTAFYGNTPCKEGTFSSAKNLQSKDQCQPCQPGFRCNRPAMNSYNNQDNYCIDGYVCNAGTSAATSQECDRNAYCQAGVSKSCPAGTFGSVVGLASINECTQCPPGEICLVFYDSKIDCTPGYYCQGGVSAEWLPDGTCPVGKVCPSICPAGSYCPSKSKAPLKCSPGTFASSTKQASCTPCPFGFYCQNTGTVTPVACTAFMTCPVGSIVPRPCPIGQVADNSGQGNVCVACPKGKYCWPELGQTSIKGNCEPGYVCQSGSYSPKPYTDTAGISATSPKFSTYNGPALRGYSSTDGQTNVPCPEGTYQPSLWAQSCLPCLAGSFCSQAAIGRFTDTNFQCPAGVICQAGRSEYLTAPKCPNGQFSLAGSPNCMLCPDGYYKDASSDSCKPCPSGSYCNSNSPDIKSCRSPDSCKGGASFDPNCNDGTFESQGSCQVCDIGNYCLGGTTSGLCAAGYLCTASSTPQPDTQCEPGYYCPHGATSMKACPAGYYRSTRGGIQASDCTKCEAGQICKRGSPPADCPQGFFCPIEDKQETSSALPCPMGTYGERTKLIAVSECRDCPSGSLCNALNVTDYKKFPCPAGKYCNQKAMYATKCPSGTYRNQTNGKSEQDCSTCPAGYYCPEGSINPIRCSGATDCPQGSKYYTTCEGGHYCNQENNYQQALCPMNYYCPRGTQYPIPCTGRSICNEGSELPLLCSAGKYVKQGEYGLINTCEVCDPGTYSTVQDTSCLTCMQGYLCYGSTNRKYPTSFTKHHGEICPKGFYCPAGSFEATPCPVGTYNPDLGAFSLTQCMLCPADTFNDKTGQQGCRPCGAYATSTEGSSTCDCIGSFRSFSHADSSCRCMSGYDYIDSITGASRGKESGTENCSPLVFDRCDAVNTTRSASGECVGVTDCSRACNGGSGKRSQTLGVCTCDNKPNVDVVCGQSCRNNASTMGIVGGTTISLSMKDSITGKISDQQIDLSKVGDVYGSLNCDPKDNCDVKTAEMSPSGGFYGKYGAPSIVENTAKKLRMLQELDPKSHARLLASESRYYFEDHRELISEVDYAAASLKNPVICMNKGDSMLFTIRDPKHFPVYLKDSVMNSNPSFDYGAFLILSDQMRTKASNNDTRPSLFTYTFTTQGSYVFVDSADSEQIMIIKITAQGESCPDPDRYIQPLSGDSVASTGVAQKSDIIIKPDVPLLVGMGSILVIAVLTVMIGVAYCLHKGWRLPKVNLRGYRNLYMFTDVDHTSEDTFRKKNDFSLFKSTLQKQDNLDGDDKSDYMNLVGDEDDLDYINLNIHMDVLEAGQEYLNIFDGKKLKRISEKTTRKTKIINIMQEIEQLINVIGSDAMINQMQIFNEQDEDGDGEERKDNKRSALEATGEVKKQQQEEQARLEEERKERMMKEWSDRDRALLDQAKQSSQDQLERLKKDLNKNIMEAILPVNQGNVGDQIAMAMYDGADVKSRHNQLVKQIEQDPNLTEAEKEALLRSHNQNLTNIDELMDAEKKKQDAELEKAIRDRVERRKKALEAKYKKEINSEVKEGELAIKEEIEARKQETTKAIDQDIDKKLEEAALGDKGAYRKCVDELKKERADRKNQMEEDLNKEQESRVKTLKEQVLHKWTAAAVNTDADLEAILTGQQPDTDEALNQLKNQRDAEEQRLQDRLAQRRRKLKQDLNQEKAIFEQELNSKDPLQEEELEKKINQALKHTIDQSALFGDPISGGGSIQLPNLTNTLNIQQPSTNNPNTINILGGSIQMQIQQKQEQEKEKEREAQAAQFQKVLNSIDQNLMSSQIMEALQQQGGDSELIENLMKEGEEEQKRKLEARRELLRQRKALKKQQELELKKLNEQMQIIQEEDDEKAKIGKNYLKELFVQANQRAQAASGRDLNGAIDEKSQQQERLVVFNEFASDEMLKRLSNLLMKQFLEREAALKLLVQKYMDARLIEKTHIKKQFKAEGDKLAELAKSGAITADALKEAQKALRLREENMLREVDLQFDKAHKEEEIKVRGDMDKRHADEQVALRRSELEDQLRLKKELQLSTGASAQQAAKDEEVERLALRAFEEAKKREQERKARSLGMHKQEVLRQIDQDLKNKYGDFEELLRRKREEESQLQDQTMSIRKRLNDRRKQIREQGSHFSEEDLKKMRERALLQLQTLESVWEEERRRQQMLMKKRLAQKKTKMEKQALLKEKVMAQEVDTLKNQLASDAAEEVFLLDIDEEQDSDLLRRLREWMRSRQELKLAEEQRQLADTTIDLDPMTLKRLIMKLDNLEKGLRDLRRIYALKGVSVKIPIPPPQKNQQVALTSKKEHASSSALEKKQPPQPIKPSMPVAPAPPAEIITSPPQAHAEKVQPFGKKNTLSQKQSPREVVVEKTQPKELPPSAKFVGNSLAIKLNAQIATQKDSIKEVVEKTLTPRGENEEHAEKQKTLKEGAEESKEAHGMKKEDYTKFKKFVKKR